MFLLNSCLDLFSAACLCRHPFSRSYGVILPSSLTMLLPSALGFSPHPPVSVYGTGPICAIAAFLDSPDGFFATKFRSASQLGFLSTVFPIAPSTLLAPVFPLPAKPKGLCPHSSDISEYRNINLLSIGYAFQPLLRSRLPQGRSALP